MRRSADVTAMALARAALLAALLAGGATAQQTIVVSPSGPIHSVSAALRVARPHARIIVQAGTYREPTIRVATPVTIVGEGSPVLDGDGARQIMTVTADDVTVRGLVFRNVGTSFVEDRAAIKVVNASACAIESNRVDAGFFGIYLANVDGCRVSGNVVHGAARTEDAAGNGIHLWSSRNVLIDHNQVSGHRDGIYFEFVRTSTIRENRSEHNLRYGLHFMYSDSCRYHDNVFRANGSGVAVMYTRDVEMVGNRFEENWGGAAYGLLLKEIVDSRLEHNRFARNSVGLVADGASRLTAVGNAFVENGWAVKIMANTEDASFTGNDFVANTFDVATNSRQNASTFRGNYWSDYTGYDLDHDGVGDVPQHPVRLFSLVIEQNAPSIILLHSIFVSLLDAAERLLPALTPETLIDDRPSMHRLT